MSRLIDKFAEKVLSTDESFVIMEGNRNHKHFYFIQDRIGNAKYIYSKSSYGYDKSFYTDSSLDLDIVAVVAEQKVFIVNKIELDAFGASAGDLPVNVHLIEEIINAENENVSSVIFPEFYDSLPIEEVTDEDIINKCREVARERLLVNGNVKIEMINGLMFNVQDILKSLCGFIDLKEEAIARLESQKEKYITVKSLNSIVDKYVKDHSVVEDYEMEIVEGLKSVNAKNVTIEFEVNGNRASEKISVKEVLYRLTYMRYFSKYDFCVMKKGEELIKKLGITSWEDEKKYLTCKNIVRITYGKKVLYER